MGFLLSAIGVLAGVGVIAAVILVIVDKLMAVPEDETVVALREELPGANCGACGYAGCDDYAAAVAAGEAANKCVPGGQATVDALSRIMGVDASAAVKRVAVVACQGSRANTFEKMEYRGLQSCKACNNLFGGKAACPDGCIGFGDCAFVCPENAISVVDGVAVVDQRKCTGCGQCAKACPKGIIAIVADDHASAFVQCSNHEKGSIARKGCSAACIGCQKCMKNCHAGAIEMHKNLAIINHDLCDYCGVCISNCPTKAITRVLAAHDHLLD